MLRRLLVKILVTALALWVADELLTGFAVADGIRGYVLAGAVLGLLSTLARPVVKLIALPLILVTFGLFTVVINALMLWLAADLTGLVTIAGLGSLFWATFILSAVHLVLRRD